MILTDYEIYDNSTGKVFETVTFDVEPYKMLNFDEISSIIHPQMHAVTYRTSILQKNNIVLDNDFYTDTEYLLLPLQYINKVEYYNINIYVYRVGQAAQSVSIPSMQKNIGMHGIVLDRLLNHYNDACSELSVAKKQYLIKMIAWVADAHLGTLLTFKMNKDQVNKIKSFNNDLQEKNLDVYNEYKKSKKMKMLLNSKYLLCGLISKLYIKKLTK